MIQAMYKMVFLTVQFNGTDRNSYFAGTDQGPGPCIDFCVGVFLGSVGKIDGGCDCLASVYQ